MTETSGLVEETSRLFQAIGSTVVRFQQVEQWLAEILAMLLRMREKDDQHLISAAMSFKQKVDLVIELYPKRKTAHLPDVDMEAVRRALCAAEEFRNRVVHSFWALECGDKTRWMRLKGSLRGRNGFSMYSTSASVRILEECNEALNVIRQWFLSTPEALEQATATIAKYQQGSCKNGP